MAGAVRCVLRFGALRKTPRPAKQIESVGFQFPHHHRGDSSSADSACSFVMPTVLIGQVMRLAFASCLFPWWLILPRCAATWFFVHRNTPLLLLQPLALTLARSIRLRARHLLLQVLRAFQNADGFGVSGRLALAAAHTSQWVKVRPC